MLGWRLRLPVGSGSGYMCEWGISPPFIVGPGFLFVVSHHLSVSHNISWVQLSQCERVSPVSASKFEQVRLSRLLAWSKLNLSCPASGEFDAMLAAASRYATLVVHARRTTP